MSVSNRVQRRQAETRQRIVEAAMDLFLTQGFEATSVAQISEAADIGKGTFFTYFAAKQDVLSFLGGQVMEAMEGADDPHESGSVRLRRIFDAAAQWFAQNEAPARQMCIARMTTFTGEKSASSRDALLRLLTSVVSSAMEGGEFRAVDRDAAVILLASAYFASVALWTWDPEGPTLADRLAGQLDLALAALLA